MTTRCLSCRQLTAQGPRCVPCTRTHRRTQNASRVAATGGSGWAWSRIRLEILRRDQYRCVQCGYGLGSWGDWQWGEPERHLDIDHIVPLAEGGTSDMANLRTLCTTCHAKKGR